MNALVIIDMQHAYFTNNALREQKNALIHAVEHQAELFRSRNDLIINVKTLHSHSKETWTLNMLEDDRGFAFTNTEEAKTCINLPENTVEITKTRDSAFHETELLDILKNHHVTHITLVGVSAHSCIFHTAAAAYAYNIPVTLVRSAIGDEDAAAMERSFDYLVKEYRQTIINS